MTLDLQARTDEHQHGVELFHQGRYEESVRAIGEALLSAETAERWNDWAAAQLACHRPAAAEEGFRRALSLDASNAQAAANLGILLASRHRYREALGWLERGAHGLDAVERAALEGLLAECREKSAAGSGGTPAGRERIVVLGLEIPGRGGTKAAVHEALRCFDAIRRDQSGGDYLLVSIEPGAAEATLDPLSGLLSAPMHEIPKILERLAPDQAHVFTPDPPRRMFPDGLGLPDHRVRFNVCSASSAGASAPCAGTPSALPSQAGSKAGSTSSREPRSNRRPREAGILFQGAVYGGSGYADENLNVVLELERAGLPVQLEPVGLRKDVRNLLSSEVVETLEWLQRPRIDLSRSVYYQCTPAHDFNLDVHGRYRIGRTMFETDRLPTGWLERCLAMDEIWLPSEFNRQVFAAVGVPAEKLRVVPAGVDTAAFRPGLEPLPLPGRRGFNFLSVFEWTQRKGADVLLRAYLTEFRPDEDVALILRAYPRPDPTADLLPRLLHFIEREVGLKLEDAPPILLLPGFLPNQDVPRLYGTADALVLPSRGEGYGRPYMEALSAGLPVIATRWSGQLDFLNDENSYLVDCEVVPAPPDVDVELFSGHCWAEPGVDSLKTCLRSVFNHRDEARRRAMKGQADMLARYDWPVVGRRWVEEFERMLG